VAELGRGYRVRSRVDLDLQTPRRLLRARCRRASRFADRALHAGRPPRLHLPPGEGSGPTRRTPQSLVRVGRLEEHLQGSSCVDARRAEATFPRAGARVASYGNAPTRYVRRGPRPVGLSRSLPNTGQPSRRSSSAACDASLARSRASCSGTASVSARAAGSSSVGGRRRTRLVILSAILTPAAYCSGSFRNTGRRPNAGPGEPYEPVCPVSGPSLPATLLARRSALSLSSLR